MIIDQRGVYNAFNTLFKKEANTSKYDRSVSIMSEARFYQRLVVVGCVFVILIVPSLFLKASMDEVIVVGDKRNSNLR
jgi:hypothetical protein